MKWLPVFIALVLLAGCGDSDNSGTAATTTTLAKTDPPVLPTTTPYEQVFHVDDLEPTFVKISGLTGGELSEADAKKMAAEIKALKKGGKGEWHFHSKTDGGSAAEVDVHAEFSDKETRMVKFESSDKAILESISKTM